MRRLIRAFAVRICSKLSFRMARPIWRDAAVSIQYVSLYGQFIGPRQMPVSEQRFWACDSHDISGLSLSDNDSKKVKMWSTAVVIGALRVKSYLSHNIRKHTFGYVRQAKIQISLLIRAVWSVSSLGALFDSQNCKVSSCIQRRLWSDCADAQSDLSLLWAHMSEGTFSHVTVPLWCTSRELL